MKSFTELVSYLSGTPKGVRVEHQPTDQKETAMQYDMSLIGNRPKPVYIEATITNFTKGGSAFAREADGMRDIFVPVAVVERMDLDRGDQVIATTVPNRLYESWTPDLGVMRPAELFAIHIVKADESAIRAMQDASAAEQMIKVKSIEERLLEALEHGPCRAAMLAKYIGDMKVDTVFGRLETLHKDGLVARSSIYSTQGQVNASYVVWALDAKELIPELAELDMHGEDNDLPNLQG
jgi:DNA-binding HxlR family transcriptional regulator